MTKKELVNATINEKMTIAELKKALATLDFEVKVSVSKKNDKIRNIYDVSGKNKFASVEIVEEVKPVKKVVKKSTTKKTTTKKATKKEIKNNKADLYAKCDRTPVKEVGNGYVIYYTMKGDEKGKVKMNNKIRTCAEIKVFIKKLHSMGKVTTLNIYKMGENYGKNRKDIHRTRISAWVGKELIAL